MCASLIEEFEMGAIVNAGDDVASASYIQCLEQMASFKPLLESIGFSKEQFTDPAQVASGIEFILEGLHLSKMLNKETVGDSGIYRARA